MSVAYILGNGITRTQYDIKNIYESGLAHFNKGCVYGCNAIYRDYSDYLDYLVAMDPIIINEIKNSSFPKDKFILPSLEEQYEPIEFNPSRPRNNSAMIAMKYAIEKGNNHLICLGLDFVIEDKNINIDNIYNNTNGYGEETRAQVYDTIARCRFMEWFARKHPYVQFTFVFPEKYKFRINYVDNIDIQLIGTNI